MMGGRRVTTFLDRGEEYDVIVDAIFGVGLKREVAGRHREVIERLNQMDAIMKIVLQIRFLKR